MRVMVFLHGTAVMHATALGRSRAERVRQSSRRDPSVLDFASYIPTEGAVRKVRAWQRNGAVICYLSSHRAPNDVRLDRDVLAANGFPAGEVFWRRHGETYAGVIRRAQAQLVVEDDCESIGGTAQMIAPGLELSGAAVRSVVVPEFGGLAHLPDDLHDLAAS